MSSALLIVAGLAGLLIGAELLVRGGAALASHLGVSAIVIGLTVVAPGTSLPELAVGIDAVRGNRDLAVGNLLGSSVYNIALILGIAVLVAPGEVEIPREAIGADLLILAVAAVITVPVLVSGHRISRLEGGAFVGAYVGYLVWLTLV